MLICLEEVSRKFSYFFEYFFICRNSKSIYLRYLKIFSKVINMFFEFIRCQIMSRNFPRIFGAFEIFSDIKNDFSHFLKLLLILKI
jgi:hypothetical protein